MKYGKPLSIGKMLIRFSNIFLNIFLKIFYSIFQLIQSKIKMNLNSWITSRIIISYDHKRELYKESCNNNNNTVASYYRDYSKILSVYKKASKLNITN